MEQYTPKWTGFETRPFEYWEPAEPQQNYELS